MLWVFKYILWKGNQRFGALALENLIKRNLGVFLWEWDFALALVSAVVMCAGLVAHPLTVSPQAVLQLGPGPKAGWLSEGDISHYP